MHMVKRCVVLCMVLTGCSSPLGVQDPSIPVGYALEMEWVQVSPIGPFDVLACQWTPALGPSVAAIVFSETSQSITVDNWTSDWTQMEPWFAPPGGGDYLEGEPFAPGWDGWGCLVVWDGWDGQGTPPVPVARSNVVAVPDTPPSSYRMGMPGSFLPPRYAACASRTSRR